jgi:hypothetical protein
MEEIFEAGWFIRRMKLKQEEELKGNDLARFGQPEVLSTPLIIQPPIFNNLTTFVDASGTSKFTPEVAENASKRVDST